jgi:hypothetical protein
MRERNVDDPDARAEALRAFDEVIDRFGGALDADLRREVIDALFGKAALLAEGIPAYEPFVLDTLDEIVRRCVAYHDAHEEFTVYGARALYLKAETLFEGGPTRHWEGHAILEELRERHGSAASPEIQEVVAESLLLRASAYADNEPPCNDEAMALLSELISDYASSSGSFLCSAVGRAHIGQGTLCLRAQPPRLEEAIGSFERAAACCSDASDEETRQVRAAALLQKACVLQMTTPPANDEAMVILDAIVTEYQGEEGADIRGTVAEAYVARGALQALLQPPATSAALADFAAVVSMYGEDPACERHVAEALTRRAGLYTEMGAEWGRVAVETHEQLIRRFIFSEDPDVRIMVADALIDRGIALATGAPPDPSAASRSLEEAFAFASTATPPLPYHAASALLNLGLVHANSDPPGRTEALAVFADVIERFADDPDEAQRAVAAQAWLNKGLAIADEPGGQQRAIAEFDALAQRFLHDSSTGAQGMAAMGMLQMGLLLMALEPSQNAEALSTFDAVLELGRGECAGTLAQAVASVMLAKAEILSGSGRRQREETRLYDGVVERFSDSGDPYLDLQVATALVRKGIAFSEREPRSPECAAAAYDAAIERFAESDDPDIREQIKLSLLNKSEVLGDIDGATAGDVLGTLWRGLTMRKKKR